MNIKNTRLWKFAKEAKNKRIKKKRYKDALKMLLNQYEDYLVERSYEMMQRKAYFASHAYRINFDNPSTFTEKRQWLKLYDQDPRKTIYTDKYEVRKHIKEVLGEDYLIPLISIDGKDCFDSVKEIDFDKLPNSFVIKCTHGSHMNIIVKDKSKLSKKDFKNYKKQLNEWLHTNYAYVVALELQYKDIQPRLIIEQFVDFEGSSLTDYKFFCFSGDVKFVGIFENRWSDEYKETYLDNSFRPLKFRLDPYDSNPSIEKPSRFDEMVKIAKKLCEGFLMVRVDLYEANGKVFFGELTFSSAAGYDFPNPYEYDRILGDYIQIDPNKRKGNYKYRKHENN